MPTETEMLKNQDQHGIGKKKNLGVGKETRMKLGGKWFWEGVGTVHLTLLEQAMLHQISGYAV